MAENLGTLGTAFIDIVAGTDKVENQMSGLQRTVRGVATAIGVTLTAAGIVKVFKDVVGAASDFESSFAGIRKTMEGSESDFQAMSDGMRQLAKEIPVPVTELNKIGETAGQMGIAKEAVIEFTRVIAGMAIATNLSSEAAATSMAKIANIMGIGQGEFDRMGSTIVELGNKGSSTEAEIVNMAMRFASAGNQVGLTTPQILGWAAALADVGVEAEAGGTALTKSFSDISIAVATGNETLAGFAKVALPKSSDAVKEFSDLFKKDANAALELFIAGLGKLKESGGNVILTLEELGIKEVRQSNALRALSTATFSVADHVAIANKGWVANSSLMTEVEKRTQTFESQMQLLKSSMNDLAISAGNALLPAFKSIVSSTSEFLDQASRGEGPINGLAAAVLALGAAFAVIKIAAVVQSFIALGTVTAGGGALAGLGGGLANAATATFSLRTAALAAGPALMALAPAALIAAIATTAYQIGNLYGKIKELHSAEGNLAVSEENARQQTILLAQAIRDKYGVEISGAGKSLEQWRTELHEFARTADPVNNKTVQMAESARKKEEADKKAAERTAQLTEEQKKLNEKFQAALKPADDLNKELAGLSKQTDAAIIAVYADQIIAAAKAQREHGFAVTGTVGQLEGQAIAFKANAVEAEAVAERLKNINQTTADMRESFKTLQAASTAWLESIAPSQDLGDVLKAAEVKRKPQEARLKQMDESVSGRAADAEAAALKHIEQTRAAVLDMRASGAGFKEIWTQLGPDIDKAADSAGRFGVQLGPTMDGLIGLRAEFEADEKAIKDFVKATEEAAQAWRDHWANAMAGVSDSVQDGLSRLGDEKIGTIFGNIGKDAGNIFVDAFQIQLEAPMDSLFATWGAKLAGHLSKAISGISSKVSGLFGIGGGLIGEVANAGIGMAISAGISLAKNLVGKGRRTANEFVGEVENPFGAELDRMVSAFNREKAAGSLSQDDVDRTRDAVTELINSFMRASNDFAAQGETQAKVVAQSQAHMEELFGPGFENILSGLDIVIGDLETGANALKEEIQAALEQAQREDRFQAALKPADELNEELAKMAAHSPADLVAVFGREILSAARAQREHGYAVAGMVAELEPLAMAVEAMNDTTTGTPKWQPRVAANITDAQREALGLMTANQGNAAAMAAAVAAGAPTVAAMNIPYDATRAASQIFSDAVNRFVPAVDAIVLGATALSGTQMPPIEINNDFHFEITDGANPLVIRDKVIPEIITSLETGIRGFREKFAQLIGNTLKGVTSNVVPTTA